MKTVDNDAILFRRKFYYPDCELKQSEFSKEVIDRLDDGVFALSRIGVTATLLFDKEKRAVWAKLIGQV